MPLGILNNIPSLAAENELTLTSNALNTTLEQLSSGQRINSGADDPAGLSIANGLQANIAALTQSVANANDGVGQLQLADGALAQVTTLLDTAVTLATESATGTVSNSQRTAIQAQYASILAEINRIGTSTTYNGQEVFQGGVSTNLNAVISGNNGTTAPLTAATPLTIGDTTTVSAGGQTFSYTATGTGTADPNTVTGSTGNLTSATALNSGTVLTLTRGTGGLTTTYTVGAGGATLAQLIAAVNTGTTQGAVTVGGTDTTHTGYSAALNATGNLQITDQNDNNDLAAALTGSSVANEVATTGQNFTASTSLIASGVFSITRGTDVAQYTIGSAGATVQQLITAINTGTNQSTGANQGITVAQHAGGAASTADLTATLVNGNLVITDGTAGADGALTAAETGTTNTNTVLGSVGTLTSNTSLGAGDVFTATRNGTQVTTYTVGSAGANVGQLLTAINSGQSVAGANGAGNVITVGTSGGGSAANYSAALVSGALQVNDLSNAGDLTFVESGQPNTNIVTTNSTAAITGATTIASGEVFTLNRGNGVSVSYTSLANTSTVTELIADIASGTTDAHFTVSNSGNAENLGLTAAVSNGQLVVTDNTGGTLSATDTNGSSLGGTTHPPTNTDQAAVTGTFADNGQQLVLAGSANTNPITGAFTDNTSTPSTVQDLLNAINNNTTVGAKAQLENGVLEITDPLDRGDLAVTTTDPVLGAPAAGAPTTFANQTTTSTAEDENELVGSSSGLTLTSGLTNGAVTAFTVGGKTFTYTAGATSTVGSLINAINTPSLDPAGLTAYLNSAGSLVVTDPNNDNDIAVSSTNTETVLGTYANPVSTASEATNIFLSDSTAIGSSQIAVTIGGLSASSITDGDGNNAVDLATTDLNTQADAQAALTQINQAVSNIASTRGTLGASVNRLTAASNVLNSQVQNLTSAENTILAADIPTAVANLTKYSILEQTGISALAQANQQQQLVLKLLQ